MQAAGNLVRGVVELTARVQDGHDHLGGRDAFLGVDIHRDAAAVVRNGHRLIGVDGDDNTVTVAGQGLVYRVVDDLEHHVVEAGAIVGIADVHAGAFANRLQAS